MLRLPHLASAIAAFVLLMQASTARATDFKSAQTGQPITDNLLGIGNFQIQFPAGPWVLVSKGAFRVGALGTGTPTPSTLNMVAARTEGSKVVAVVFLAAPETTFQATSKWSDDPCKAETAAVVKDTLDQTFSMPECFTVGNFGSSQRSTAVADAQKWAKDANMSMPSSYVRVYYTKYHGGDYLRITTYLAGDNSNIADAEAWGRAGVSSISPMVRGKSSPGVLPALPPFAK